MSVTGCLVSDMLLGKQCLNESAIIAARANKTYVQSDDFEKASEKILAGYEKTRLISENEKKVTAYHESGHAVVSWFLKGGAPLLKVL